MLTDKDMQSILNTLLFINKLYDIKGSLFMRKFNLANAYAVLRPSNVRLMNGLIFVCEFPGFKV